MQKHIYLENGVRYSDFNEILDPPEYPQSSGDFSKNCFPAIFDGHLELRIKGGEKTH